MLLRGEKNLKPIIQSNESTLPMGPLGEFSTKLSVGELKKKQIMPLWGKKKIETNQKPSLFSGLGLPLDPKGEGDRVESTPEQLQNDFQKGLKTGF